MDEPSRLTGSTMVPVSALALPGTTLYIGGGLLEVNGVTNSGEDRGAHRVDRRCQRSWLPNPNDNVTALAVSTDGSTV